MVTLSSPAVEPPPRFRVLDGLRFVAAMSVVGFHFTARESEVWGTTPDRVFPTLSQYAAYGTLGVEFFFVISGFVILMTAWDRSVASYTASRIGRLFPAYWAGALLSAFLLLVLWPEGRPTDVGEVLVNLTMAHEAWGVHRLEGVYWTLWIELRFYVLVGLLMVVGITRGRLLAFCALWPVAAAVAGSTGSPLLEAVLMPTHAPLFAGGMMLFFITREGHSLLAWLVVAGNAVFAANAADHGARGRIDDITAVEHSSVVVWVVTLGCFAVVAAASMTRLRAVSWGWLTVLGALTYPLYLVHEFWGRYVIELLSPRLPGHLVLALAVGVGLALAWLVHRYVERPFSARLRRSVQRTLEEPARRHPAGAPSVAPAAAAAAPAAVRGRNVAADLPDDETTRMPPQSFAPAGRHAALSRR
ncbi:Peptidoglycan/LPS O-acetylase OafA/YrhL, contains acyltransferase and SGNH-hydrolase domains [Geodermatophilus obscurus]|uniref:Peptidoglycan/LPS O-acetylase OafA/YrhL, contains acyltransferase and SGNH-hydrolase domains n=1 Tax=Geodermatophilus obscurus TaxID=1861 RepID=A0A1I5F9W0_9ACTN|nr:acyltransferase [Geodermatophilus obscurus]SFO20460.1 Peptidoglycan/LPS O-acetylase OafA/YrhL, contains acyltransferase and SGNH-hydrolase domains [Geodermatophilus obscurus]